MSGRYDCSGPCISGLMIIHARRSPRAVIFQNIHGSAALFVIPRACSIALVMLFVGVTAATAQTLRWGGDAEGGAPYVEADPRDVNKVVGFDAEIAELIAKQLG